MLDKHSFLNFTDMEFLDTEVYTIAIKERPTTDGNHKNEKGFRLKFRKAASLSGKNWFESAIYRRSNGSLIAARTGPFWFAFKVFLSPTNYWRALTW